MLIISSLAGAKKAFSVHKPQFVVSLLTEEEAAPVFAGLAEDRHLKLCVPSESCAEDISKAARRRAEQLVAFMKTWDGESDILVHCNRGVARSTAAAFVIMCMAAPDADEQSLAARLHAAAPYADPCPLLIAYADELLGRDGRLIDAIEDLPPPSPSIEAPTLTLPLAA
jgi:predicted protein tyrosine phosphatase